MAAKERDLTVPRALRDLVIDATEEELRADLEGAGENFDALVARGHGVIECALSGSAKDAVLVQDLHRGLGALVRMLRRRDQLSVEKLASAAEIDIAELQAIESEPSKNPHPRTIYQLAKYFHVEPKSLVALSGAVAVNDGVRREAVRFAASSRAMSKLSREERKLLNQFVRFLQDQSDR